MIAAPRAFWLEMGGCVCSDGGGWWWQCCGGGCCGYDGGWLGWFVGGGRGWVWGGRGEGIRLYQNFLTTRRLIALARLWLLFLAGREEGGAGGVGGRD